MSIRQSLAGAMRFAHLVTPRAAAVAAPAAEIVPPAARADDGDDEDMQKQLDAANRRAEDAEERAKKAEEELKKAKKAKKGKKAEGEAASSETDDDDDDDDDEGDDDSDREEAALPAGNAIRAARGRERTRCAAIFADPAAALNPALAAELAFNGDMPRGQALGILRAAGASQPAGLDARMARQKVPVLAGAQPEPPDATDPKVVAAGIIKSYEQARGLVRSA